MTIESDPDRALARYNTLAAILAPVPRLVIVDIGASPIETPPYQFLKLNDLCDVWGFEPQPQEFERLQQSKRANEKYQPHALGDGTEKTLNITKHPGFTSTLMPNLETLSGIKRWQQDVRIASQVKMQTKRLDDIAELPEFDLLKIDVQGSEHEIMCNGMQKISNARVVITEVAAIPIYVDQPLLDKQIALMDAHGFTLHKFLPGLRSVPLRTRLSNQLPRHLCNDQLTDGDAVFVRDLLALDGLPDDALKKLCILADFGFQSFSLALKCLDILAQRHVLDIAACDAYLDQLRKLDA